MSIIPWIQNKAEILWWAEQTEQENADYKKQQENAEKKLPEQKQELNNAFYPSASSFSVKFWENLKKLKNSENITLAIKETWYNKEEWQTQEDFIDELAERWANIQMENEKWVEKESKKPKQSEENTSEKPTKDIEAPESAEPIVNETTRKVWDILGNTEKKESVIDKNLLFAPLKPLIDWLESNWYIQKSSELKKRLNKWKDIKKELVNSIEWNKELKENITNYFEQKETITPKTFEKSKFWVDSQTISLKIESVWWLELLMAENYISIPNKKTWKNNIEEDISRSMNISLNKILKVNSKEFKEANYDLISKIQKSTNIESKYKNLSKLHDLDLKSDSKFFSKNDKLRKKKVETKIATLEKKYKSFLVTMDIKKQNEQMKIREQIMELREQLLELNIKKPKSWEVMWGSDFDKNPNWVENILKNT